MIEHGVRTTHFFWPDVRRGPWEVAIEWKESVGRLECTGFHLTPVAGQEGLKLTTTVLREISLPQFMKRVASKERQRVKHLAELAGKPISPDSPTYTPVFGGDAKHLPTVAPRPGGRTREIDDVFLARVAEVYTKSFATQERLRPRMAVKDAFKVSPSTAAKYIYMARKRGFLPATDRGRPSAG